MRGTRRARAHASDPGAPSHPGSVAASPVVGANLGTTVRRRVRTAYAAAVPLPVD